MTQPVDRHDPPQSLWPHEFTLSEIHSCDVERRNDGAVVVRVHSRSVDGRALPDAVFAFRQGDPQFAFWAEKLRQRETLGPGPLLIPLPLTEPTAHDSQPAASF